MRRKERILTGDWQDKAIEMIEKGYKILILFCNGDSFLSYKACKLYYNEQLVAEFPGVAPLKRFLSRFRLMARLFRLEPRCAEKLDDDRYVIEFKRAIWLLNTRKKSLRKLMTCSEGFSGTLNFCSDGNNVIWGDYGSNYHRNEVNVYRCNQEERLSIVHTFKPGEVRHVHNIIWDKSIEKFWILTGDTDNESAMYHADKEWEGIEKFVGGSQKYRAVAAFSYKEGLIYATDAVEQQNYLYYISRKTNDVERLCEINGSCIYGGENLENYFFSTVVEPTEKSAHPKYLYTLGKGIKDWNVNVLKVSKADGSISVVMKLKKDLWPMRYFKYGCVVFPHGQESSTEMMVYPIAVKKYDGRNLIIK